jgi:hypothetical protein
MLKGYIPHRKETLCWLPEKEKPPLLLLSEPSPNAVKISEIESFTGQRNVAYLCKPCNEILIDLNRTEVNQ